MDFVGLDYETYANRSPFQLSGGQMRRVAIAGVVALNPSYLNFGRTVGRPRPIWS